ncbi:hypothetical protein FF38_06963 [Lucilia cuprina]|uniref:Prominin-1 n=1 Tax=Lucilia cuprina TaxID=7375 RepID=A0A0L0C8P6_LUCCU|nr:hypothetical protein FF38_06963 [Lucilia cuprina]
MTYNNETLPSSTGNSATGTFFTYHIPGMDVNPGPYVFTLVSQFLGMITPDELPLGQVRQLIHSNLTIINFATNAIKTESGFIALMSIFMILALVPILAACAWCCCRRSPAEELEYSRHAPVIMIDDTLEDTLQCRKKASITTIFSDLCIFYANSRLATTVEMTPEMIKSTVHDMEVFLKDTHLQIKHKLDNGFHVSVEKVVKDLEDVDVLLGEPIQAEISAHTGIELAYDSLATLSLVNAELIYRVLMLQETVGRALKLAQEAAARMEELQIQLSVLQRQCTYRDRPLCDTLRIRSFEENGIIDALKTLQEDQAIFRMRYLGEIEMGATVKNLSSEVGLSHTLEQLDSIRHRTTANAQMLTVTINALLERLKNVWPDVEPQYVKLQDWSNVYWTSGWVAGMVIVWILLFLLMSYCCFLCDANIKAGVILFVAVVIICLSSICITVYGVVSLAIGGNAEIFLCQPMYDDGGSGKATSTTSISTDIKWNMGGKDNNKNNAYDVLGKLFDKPGYVYLHEPQTGIIGELLRPDGVNHSIVNVSLATALRGCEKNEASYNVFQLDAFVNTTAISDIKQFPKVTQAIDAIDVSERTLLSLTQTIQTILENMLQMSSFNLTIYRTTIGAPTPEKDLATFIDQMQRVALQIQDVATSSRMTTLGSRSKRLQASILQPLEQLQNEILYHLTALELQRDPWAKQVNQTLNHLRNIQEYLEKMAGEICQNQTRIYTERLKTYLSNDKATMSSQLGETTARCRPFFDIFDANRIFLCRNMIDFVNALWFFTFLTLLLWSIATPVGLNLISLHRKINGLRKAKLRAAERATERGDSFSRGRRRDRGRSTSRDRERSTSSTGRPRPTLQRTATEETLDIENLNDEPSQRSQMGRERERERERERSRERERERERSRERERERQSRSREVSQDNLGGRRGGQIRRQGTEEESLDSGPSRGTSYEREESQSRVRSGSSAPQRQSRPQQSQPQRSRFQQPPPLRRQGTEEFALDDDETWQSPAQTNRGRGQPRRGEAQRNKRSITPVLTVRPDAQPAQPKPRTPTRLKSRVSLTSRAVRNIVENRDGRNRGLQRQNTEDFELDDDDNSYGTSRSTSQAVQAARRTPPRSAPPPPPPPSNRFKASSVRSVRWHAGDEEMVFEDCDSANPMYMSHDLND